MACLTEGHFPFLGSPDRSTGSDPRPSLKWRFNNFTDCRLSDSVSQFVGFKHHCHFVCLLDLFDFSSVCLLDLKSQSQQTLTKAAQTHPTGECASSLNQPQIPRTGGRFLILKQRPEAGANGFKWQADET